MKRVPVLHPMAGGAKATRLNATLMSRHQVMPDGFSPAVDLGTFPWGGDAKQHRAIWEAMKTAMAMAIEGAALRSGIDWWRRARGP